MQASRAKLGLGSRSLALRLGMRSTSGPRRPIDIVPTAPPVSRILKKLGGGTGRNPGSLLRG
jgi:hypothetical protein